MHLDRKIIIGLGNPGEEYEKTYHNLGFLAVDYLAGSEAQWKLYKKLSIESVIMNGVVYAKPLVFMNNSGLAVKAILQHFGVDHSRLLVIHDDSDLYLGEFKIVSGGGSAGHHGIDSIISALKTEDFKRVKIGIRSLKERTRQKSQKFVLRKISRADFSVLAEVFTRIREALFD